MEWRSNAEHKPDSVAARDCKERADLPKNRQDALEDPRNVECIRNYVRWTRVRPSRPSSSTTPLPPAANTPRRARAGQEPASPGE